MEIGSEFWKANKKFILKNEEWYLAGRTALNAIIKEIVSEETVSSALLPSYCCYTMIEPFYRNNIPVRFYDVFVDSDGEFCADVPIPKEKEIFYVMKYFGNDNINYVNSNTRDWNRLWTITIEDITHNCFNTKHMFAADYEFASYRKWMAFDGISVAKKKKGSFSNIPAEWKINSTYCLLRNKAFEMKLDFMSGRNISKAKFLHIFEEAENCLAEKYVGFRPDLNTIIQYFFELGNIEQFRSKRQYNSKLLVEGLRDIPEITILLNKIDMGICPLFVPIVVPLNIRDSLKQYLIEQDIYCPVHWPLSELHEGISERAREIYGKELSLICDQRYSKTDIEREIQVIRNYFGYKKDESIYNRD